MIYALDQPAFNRNRLNAKKLIDSMLLEQDPVKSNPGAADYGLRDPPGQRDDELAR